MNEKQIEALKKIQASLGAVVGEEPATTTMTVDKFLTYAQEQVAKAVGEAREKSGPRLKALRATMEKAVKDFGAMIATNEESESIKVTVYTEDTTASDELSSKEIPITTAIAGGGGTQSMAPFSKSESREALDKVTKALGIGAPPPRASKEAAPLAKNDGVDNEGWPENLNDPRYRETRKSASAPLFGYDADRDANVDT